MFSSTTSSDEQAQEKSLLKSLVHSFVMIMGGYDFDFLWQASSEAQNFSEETKYIPVRLITMVLLITLIMFGTLILMNLIVAFIITDMGYLMEVTKLIALRNQAHHAVQTKTLQDIFSCFVVNKEESVEEAERLLVEEYCMHSVCHSCQNKTLEDDLSNNLLEIVGTDHRVYRLYDD